jgi:transcriptional regulator NrdR family protein
VTHIIKRGIREYESYSREKLHRSIVSVCRSVHTSEGSAETAATAVCDAVDTWLKKRPEVTSSDIRRIAGRALKTHNPDAAYYYTQHKHIM